MNTRGVRDLFCSLVADWFGSRFSQPTLAQERAWPVLVQAGPVLITAPTGAGKTLAAFMPFINSLVLESQEGCLDAGIRVIYVSPLKALSNDVKKNLDQPLCEINALLKTERLRPLTLGLRTGDSTAAERARIVKDPPHILVTTPESLYLMLTSDRARSALAGATTVIVDEIHTLARDKRGSHLMLSLERLDALCPKALKRIGLSATVKPLDTIGAFLSGGQPCAIVDARGPRQWDLGIETPSEPLGAICTYEMWDEVYARLTELIQSHTTTLIFVNTRRMAERLAHQLEGMLGLGMIASHHGSMAKDKRLEAEELLKAGQLRAIVATASLELGIDIGAIDLVCQVGSPRSIATFVQRVGRSGHTLDRTPKGRLFALTRDELIESMALVRAAGAGEMDSIELVEAPLDILAQQIVAAVSVEDWADEPLYDLCRRAYPFRELSREVFDSVLRFLAEGMAPGVKRGAYLHHDKINHILKGRRSARLTAITSGGAIPEQNLYRVIVEGEGTLVGTLDEDFAIESARGDIFQLGNTSWIMMGIRGGNVMVQDAKGAPPTIPFWNGESPGRTFELSSAVSHLRHDIAAQIPSEDEATAGATPVFDKGRVRLELQEACGVTAADADQAIQYIEAQKAAIGTVPTQQEVVWERFFDEAGGMQLVIHAPFGTRINRAWGLALRKRFCRSFDFELQASADDDGIVLSIGPNQGFAIDSLFKLLRTDTAQGILVQALLDAPMFQVRWRWNVTRALAVLRFKSGKRVPPQMQRFQSDDLLTAVFPQQTQCFEHRTGDIEVPDHPLVRQTVSDCLTEAMDVGRWVEVLRGFEEGRVRFTARDTREPSPFAYQRLNANPYAFLDDAPLEERRARAVSLRRVVAAEDVRELGTLSEAAIARVRHEAWPLIRDAEELHEALVEMVLMRDEEFRPFESLLSGLLAKGRALVLKDYGMACAMEAWPTVRALYPALASLNVALPAELEHQVEREDAILALVQGRLEVEGPLTAEDLAARFHLDPEMVAASLAALEGRGIAISGAFTKAASGPHAEWCERRLLSRIHRLTIQDLRDEIKPLPPEAYLDFLGAFQHASEASALMGEQGVRTVLLQMAGLELPAGAWEGEALGTRIKDYRGSLLDHWLMTGECAWGRLSPPEEDPGKARFRGWSRDMPLALFPRDQLPWILRERAVRADLEPGPAQRVEEALRARGALFYSDIVRATRLLPAEVHEALGRMAHLGLVASDNWSGLRPYFGPDRRAAKELGRRDRSGASQPGVSAGGRWFLFPPVLDELSPDERLEQWAWLLLRRWGVVFFDLMTKERLAPPWRDMVKVLRRLEARGQIRGGRFITGVGGEQYALPGVVEALRAHKSLPSKSEVIVVSAADPLNLFGIITPDQRIPATRGNRVAILGGKLIGWRMGGHIEVKPGLPPEDEAMVTRALRLTGVFRRQDPFLREWQQQKSRPALVPQDLRLRGNFR